MYALNLDPGTSRILSATFPEYATEDMPRVEELPDGDISNYLYRDGGFIYSPPPAECPRVSEDIEAGKIFAVGGEYYRATMPIPRGEPVTRYNAEAVSMANILNALQEQKGE